jgi:tetratricopeptide (TPR) repeat protein
VRTPAFWHRAPHPFCSPSAEGINQLEAALRLAPQTAATRANLAAALAQSGRLPEAAEQFQALLLAKPDDAEAHAQFAGVLAGLGRRDEAIAHLETAVRLQPDNADGHNQLGTLLGRAGRVREGLGAIQRGPPHRPFPLLRRPERRENAPAHFR